MAGKSASNNIVRYAGLQVQTSSLGLQIPVGWGTFRCKCNLVDYLDFKSVAQHSGGGKGGNPVTGYNYQATIVLAICEGPIDSISLVYVDSKIYSANGHGSPLSQVGLGISTGAVGQAVWSYLTSNHPDHAIGYSGLTVVYAANYPLGSSAASPNHSFEVVRLASFGVAGTEDADASLVIADFFNNNRYGVPSWKAGLLGDLTQYQNYCLAAGLLISPVIDSQRSASDFLTEVLRATNSTCLWSEGLLKFIPYGDEALTANGKTYIPNNAAEYSLTDDDFIVRNEGDLPLLVDLLDQSDAYNVVQLEYLDRTNQYNMAIALASDAANVDQYGMRRKDPDTVHCICNSDAAAVSAHLFLQRSLYIRANYHFSLPWNFSLLEPGDILEITDAAVGLYAYPVRIIQIDEDESSILDIIAEDFPIGVGGTPLYTMQTSVATAIDRSVDPGGVEANLLKYSQDLSQSAWFKENCTISGTHPTSPYGDATGQLVTATASGDAGVCQWFTAGSLPGRNFTFSAYLERGNTSSPIRIQLQSSNGLCIKSYDVVPPSGSWGRYTITLPMNTSADTVANVWIFQPGANAGNNFAVWGVQLTEGVVERTYAATASDIAGPYLFNPPSVLTAGAQSEVMAAVAGGANWGGCNVWVSIDGTSYQMVGSIYESARFGSLTTSVGSVADPDSTSTFTVDLGPSGGELSTATTSVADAAGTLCLIDQELISFSTTTLTNPSRYSLSSYTRRGALNSQIAAHSAGAPFVRLDGAPFTLPYFAVNAGANIYVKFQSFNIWGDSPQSLANCLVHAVVPIPLGATSPRSAAWTAIGTTLSNMGQSIPAIVVTGASDNPSATGIDFEYRVTGSSLWTSAGLSNGSATRKEITSVQSGQTYDVSVVYIVGGVVSGREIVASAITVGSVSTGALPGATLWNDSVPGTAKTVTLPAGPYTHVDIILDNVGGNGNGVITGDKTSGFSSTDYGGGGSGSAVVLGFPVTPGSTTLTYTLPAAVGSTATCTATGLNISANSGTNATGSAPGTGGTATITTATGASATHAYTGHNGGLVDTWDGGGAAGITGVYVDQTTNSTPGLAPGGGGAGDAINIQPGSGACLKIIARA